MPKVYGLREIELRRGVDEAEFERFVTEEWYPAWRWPGAGMRLRILRGDRGNRAGKYLLLLEFDSVEARDRCFPPPGGPSEEFQRRLEAVAEVEAKRAALMARGLWTDYVVVGEIGEPK